MSFSIERISSARIPTEEGQFELALYRTPDEKEHMALTLGHVTNGKDVLLRVHSECFTGDVLGSLRCDCGPQLKQSMRLVAEEGVGIILYLRQEGRGIGLGEKLKAYNLQDEGYDTVEANLMLGHKADARDYSVAAAILSDLQINSVRLMTNNPAKIEALADLSITVADRIPLEIGVMPENARYLETKVQRMRHLLSLDPFLPAKQLNGSQPIVTPKRAQVTLSYAQSLDGSITARRGEPLAISGPQSMTMSHRLRASHDAILIGIGTLLADDPQLTVRLTEGHNPQPIVLDSELRTPTDARLFSHPTHKPWIVTTERAAEGREQALADCGARILRVAAGPKGRVSLPDLLAKLPALGIHNLMVEGGADVITSFLSSQLVDHVVLTVAPLFVGGLNAVGSLGPRNGHGWPQIRNPHYQWMGKDMVLAGDVAWDDDTS